MTGRPERCPIHGVLLDGGPVRYHCRHGHAVPAADLDHEYQPPPTAKAVAR